MDKQQLEQVLDSIPIQKYEGFVPPENHELPYVCYWEINWDFATASGQSYQDVVKYQISFFSRVPRDPKLLKLVKNLRKLVPLTSVDHQLIEPTFSIVHSYFSIDILEDVIPPDDE